MLQQISISLLFLFFSCTALNAQLSGTITDELNNPLPFATIYIEGSSTGTSSNTEGNYSFSLPEGEHTIIFQYVGFDSQSITVQIGNEPQTKNVVLTAAKINLQEVLISANAEDPAYAIIRKAIEKRDYYRRKINSFKAKAYIKGLVESKHIPESFMGQDLGNLEGILDSTRQGVLYFSESESEIYFKAPNTFKEVMLSSKVSGESNGTGFNNFIDSHFNFYEEHLYFNRDFISPIADRALSYYKYKLIGTTYDKDGRMVNKIQVIQKSTNDPSFFGHIYITEDLWNIHSIDLALEGKAAKDNLIDTLNIKQLFIPLEGDENWVMFSQVLDMTMGFFSVKLKGSFSFIFTDYQLNIPLAENTFNNEIIKINEDANKSDIAYWNQVRPIPLTSKEQLDYQKKDSLEILWNTESYRDSVDRINNKFGPMNILFGYDYVKSYKNERYSFNSPLSTIQFSAVEGYKIALNLGYRKSDKDFTKYTSINPQLSYAFSEKRWRYHINLRRKTNSINNQRYEISFGRKIAQYNERGPITRFSNTLESLFNKENYIKLFEKDFVKVQYRRNLTPGLRFKTEFEFGERRDLILNSNHSIFDRAKVYESNNINKPFINERSFSEHKNARLNLSMRWTPGLKYITARKHRFAYDSKFPTITLEYNKGLTVLGSKVSYDKLQLNIMDRKANLNLWGFLAYNFEAGTFLNKKNRYLIDLFHFNGNRIALSSSIDHLAGFKRLKYYYLSNDADYLKCHLEYHTNGRILDKIPGIRNTNMQMVFSFASLFQNEVEVDKVFYREASIGVEGLGIGGLSIFRLDYTLSFPRRFADHGITLSTSQNF